VHKKFVQKESIRCSADDITAVSGAREIITIGKGKKRIILMVYSFYQ
jgi:hypothetical protein